MPKTNLGDLETSHKQNIRNITSLKNIAAAYNRGLDNTTINGIQSSIANNQTINTDNSYSVYLSQKSQLLAKDDKNINPVLTLKSFFNLEEKTKFSQQQKIKQDNDV